MTILTSQCQTILDFSLIVPFYPAFSSHTQIVDLRVTEAIESYSKGCDVFRFEFGLTHPRTATAMRNLTKVKQRRFDFHVSFATRKPTPCPAKLLGGDKKKKGKKGGKKGGKGGKKKK